MTELNKERISALAPFQHKTYRSLWLASISSNFGILIQTVGAAWLMMSISSSAQMVALVTASTSLPAVLFSLLAGAVADSYDRRKVMISAYCFMLTVSALLALCTWLEVITPWGLLGFTFLIGCGAALNSPSWHSTVSDLVPKSDVPSAVALNSMGFNVTRSVGPAIGGAIVAAAGAATSFAINAVSYLPIIIVLSRWRPGLNKSSLPRESMPSAIMAGLRYVAMSPSIGRVILRGFVFGLSAIAILSLLPLVARDLVGGGPFAYGVLLGAFGAGAVGGALASGRLRSSFSNETIVRGAFLALAACSLVTASGSGLWITGTGLLLGGASWVLGSSLFNASVQLSSPRWVVGRALSIYQTSTYGGMTAGSWVWGIVTESYGIQTALAAAAVLLAFGALLGLRFPVYEQANLNLDPTNTFKEPHYALDLKPNSGPVAISIEYMIDETDVNEFLGVMAERKRVRRRNGAHGWTLSRDLENPEIWIESYKAATLVEYVRHNQRLTHADADVGRRLHALHKGPEKPFSRRVVERRTAATPTDVVVRSGIGQD